MHFADELADPEKLHVPKKTEVGKREMNMARSLIDSMSSKWNPEKYKDDYREALMEVIEEKVEAGGKEIEEKPKKAPKATKVIDLVSVLQKSLEETGAKKKARTKSRKKQSSPQRKRRELVTQAILPASHSRRHDCLRHARLDTAARHRSA
jgi:DNA end-binding protein Ku